MVKYNLFIGIVTALFPPLLWADATITLFLKPYPYFDNEHIRHVSSQLAVPGTIAQHHFHRILNHTTVTGIFSSYAGYLTVSDRDGQLAFPRRQEKALLYLLITKYMVPDIITDTTIHHWKLAPGYPAQMYKLERRADKSSSLMYWEVTPIELPGDNTIPLQTIILFANPAYVYVPTGITLTHQTANLVLPDVYIKHTIKTTGNALYVLNIKQFFGQERILYEKHDKSYSSLIVP